MLPELIQVSQEEGKVVWYFHILKNLPQFVLIHRIKGFSIVNEAEIDVFLEFCFIYDPTDVGNLISDSSAFSKPSLNICKFLVHILLKPSLKSFEHYFASIWNECNCVIVWTLFGIVFLWDWNEKWTLLSFLNLLAYWMQYFNSIMYVNSTYYICLHFDPKHDSWISSVQFSSVTQSCLTLCDPMNCSAPGLPVHHQLPEFTQTHVHRVSDAIQPSHPLSSPSPPAPIPPSIRVFSNESTLRMRWPKYWSFSFSLIPSKEIPGLISFRMDWWDLLAVQGTLKSLLQHRSSKASILPCSAFFTVQLSHPYVTSGKTIALTRQTFVGKVTSLLLNMLSRLVITFLPMSKGLLISWLQSPLKSTLFNVSTASGIGLGKRIRMFIHCLTCFTLLIV